ncbi:MAG: TetR family transcriptional regulator [bacterium]
MSGIRDRLLQAARGLAAAHPLETISLAAVARAAGVSTPTVRRHLGNADALRALLAAEQGAPLPVPEDTRQRILDAALRTFANLGYAGATIDDIAADAGLTKGAVYWHFASKRDLFKALLTLHRERQAARLPENIAIFRRHPELLTALEASFEDDLTEIATHVDWVMLYLEFLTSSREPEIRAMLKEGGEDLQEEWFAYLRSLQADGILRSDRSAEEIAFFWSALVNGLALIQVIAPDACSPSRMAPGLAQLLMHGLAPRPGDVKAKRKK